MAEQMARLPPHVEWHCLACQGKIGPTLFGALAAIEAVRCAKRRAPPVVLDIFSGDGGWSRAMRRRGFISIQVDI